MEQTFEAGRTYINDGKVCTLYLLCKYLILIVCIETYIVPSTSTRYVVALNLNTSSSTSLK